MARSTADQPNVREFRMAVDQKVAVPGIFILANARLEDWRLFKRGNAAGHQRAHFGKSGGGSSSILGVRIKCSTVAIDCDLNASTFQIWKSISLVFKVDPNRKGRHRKLLLLAPGVKIENLLTRRVNSITQQSWKELWQPRPARKHIAAR